MKYDFLLFVLDYSLYIAIRKLYLKNKIISIGMNMNKEDRAFAFQFAPVFLTGKKSVRLNVLIILNKLN